MASVRVIAFIAGLTFACTAAAARSQDAAALDKTAQWVAPAEILRSCLQVLNKKLIELNVTPERYAMIMQGACTVEEADSLKGFDAYLRSMKTGSISYDDFDAITKNTLRGAENDLAKDRLRYISDYAIIYETKRN